MTRTQERFARDWAALAALHPADSRGRLSPHKQLLVIEKDRKETEYDYERSDADAPASEGLAIGDGGDRSAE